MLLAGSYPGAAAEPEHTAIIRALLMSGVDSFLCLQEHWELKSRCRPYVSVAQIIKAQLDWKRCANLQQLEFWHCPIPDQCVTTPSQLEVAVATLVDRLLAGRRVYVHSWGGNGRVGTVACALLVKLYGMTTEEAKCYFMSTHSTRKAHNKWSPGCWPHTQAQFAQVRQLEGQGPELSAQRLPSLKEWETSEAG
jgi:hypothetical protein